jgi:hypothetical protein
MPQLNLATDLVRLGGNAHPCKTTDRPIREKAADRRCDGARPYIQGFQVSEYPIGCLESVAGECLIDRLESKLNNAMCRYMPDREDRSESAKRPHDRL